MNLCEAHINTIKSRAPNTLASTTNYEDDDIFLLANNNNNKYDKFSFFKFILIRISFSHISRQNVHDARYGEQNTFLYLKYNNNKKINGSSSQSFLCATWFRIRIVWFLETFFFLTFTFDIWYTSIWIVLFTHQFNV